MLSNIDFEGLGSNESSDLNGIQLVAFFFILFAIMSSRKQEGYEEGFAAGKKR